MLKKNQSFFNLDETFAHAVRQLAEKNPQEVAANAAVEYDMQTETFQVPLLTGLYNVAYPSGNPTVKATGEKASIYIAIILLHYLNTASGSSLSGRWISFKELPGGQIYIDPFNKRAITPLLKVFGNQPEDFAKAAAQIGGYQQQEFGEYAYVIPALPQVPVCFIIRPGDDEFSPSANILFDAFAHLYLPTEDYAHLPGVILKELKQALN